MSRSTEKDVFKTSVLWLSLNQYLIFLSRPQSLVMNNTHDGYTRPVPDQTSRVECSILNRHFGSLPLTYKNRKYFNP